MNEGDFFLGADKDLVDRVTPIFSTSNSEVASGQIRVDTGNREAEKVAQVRFVNGEHYINKNMQMFNGTYFSTLHVDPWGSPTSMKSASNGMQFKPFMTEEEVNIYENRMIRLLNYKYQ